MGYVMYMVGSEFFVSEQNLDEMFRAIKALTTSDEKVFAFVDRIRVTQAISLADALEVWRWQPEFDEAGNLVSLDFIGEKLGDDQILFAEIASFVLEGSNLQMIGEDGRVWRWLFTQGRVIQQKGHLVFE